MKRKRGLNFLLIAAIILFVGYAFFRTGSTLFFSGRQVQNPEPLTIAFISPSPEEGARLQRGSIVNFIVQVNRDTEDIGPRGVYYGFQGAWKSAQELSTRHRAHLSGLGYSFVKFSFTVDQEPGIYPFKVEVRDQRGALGVAYRSLEITLPGFTQPRGGSSVPESEPLREEKPSEDSFNVFAAATHITGQQIATTTRCHLNSVTGRCEGGCDDDSTYCTFHQCPIVPNNPEPCPAPNEDPCQCEPRPACANAPSDNCGVGLCPPGFICTGTPSCSCQPNIIPQPHDTPLIPVSSLPSRPPYGWPSNQCFCSQIWFAPRELGIPGPHGLPLRYSLLRDDDGRFLRLGPHNENDDEVVSMWYAFNVLCKVEGDPTLCFKRQEIQSSFFKRILGVGPEGYLNQWLHIGVDDPRRGGSSEGMPDIVYTENGEYGFDNPEGRFALDAYTRFEEFALVLKHGSELLSESYGHPEPGMLQNIINPHAWYIIFQDIPQDHINVIRLPRPPAFFESHSRFRTLVIGSPINYLAYCQFDIKHAHQLVSDPNGPIRDFDGRRYRHFNTLVALQNGICSAQSPF